MHDRSRLKTSLLALVSAIAVSAILSAVCYATGRRLDPELIFLDPRRQPTVNEAIYAAMAEYALKSSERNDVLFIGDSTCAYGADPIRFEQLTGLRAYSCGTLAWMGPEGFLVLLDGYIRHHPAPRVVVLTLSPFVMEVDISDKDPDTTRRFIETFAPAAGRRLTIDGLAFYAKRGAVNLFGTGSDPRDLPVDGDQRRTCRGLASELAAGRGFGQLPGIHGPHWDHGVAPGRLIRSDWDAGVREIARRCRARGVQLLVRFAPISEAERTARDWPELDRWAKSLDGVTVARPMVVTYPPELMWDGIHLNAAGVERFMPIVAKEVQAVLKERGHGVSSTF